VRGVSKSAVSERFVYGTERKLAELMSRDLRQLQVVALLIDGVHFGEHVVLAAVGVNAQGDKHVLGLREGATENAAAVRALLADLAERGLATDRSLLIVIDGAKALRKAVVEVFGAHALIQRCREHKKRNVTDALPERLRASIRSAMNQAYATRDPKRARRLLEGLARRLEHQHPGAAASLREGLEETLTVMRFGLPENLERGAVVNEPDREPVRPGARDRPPGQTLAERHHGAALDCRRCARSRTRLPQTRRLSRDADPGRRTKRPRRAVQSYRAQG
jgi:putative transposase